MGGAGSPPGAAFLLLITLSIRSTLTTQSDTKHNPDPNPNPRPVKESYAEADVAEKGETVELVAPSGAGSPTSSHPANAGTLTVDTAGESGLGVKVRGWGLGFGG